MTLINTIVRIIPRGWCVLGFTFASWAAMALLLRGIAYASSIIIASFGLLA